MDGAGTPRGTSPDRSPGRLLDDSLDDALDRTVDQPTGGRNDRAQRPPEDPAGPSRPRSPHERRGVVPVAYSIEGDPVLVPRLLVLSAAWAWRLGVIGVVVFLAFLAIGNVEVVAIPLLLAVLISALLQPLYRLLRWARFPRFLASGVSVALFVALVAGVVALTGNQLVIGIGDLAERAQEGLDELVGLASRLVGVDESEVRGAMDDALRDLGQFQDQLVAGALVATDTVTVLATGTLLTLVAVIFYLADGERIWRFLVRLLPGEARRPADLAGRRGWETLTRYVRTVPVVATADAVGIGLGAYFLGVPLAFPIAVVTFLAAFVPLIGAIVTGAIAVLVALVANGYLVALAMLAIVFAVQQLESYVLQPLLLGRAAKIYPLAVLAAVATGLVLAGIVGGVLAVPLLGVVVAVVKSLAGLYDEVEPDAAGEGIAVEESAAGARGGDGEPPGDTETAETSRPAGPSPPD